MNKYLIVGDKMSSKLLKNSVMILWGILFFDLEGTYINF